MKFFLPLAADNEQAKRVYERIIDRLRSIGCELTAQRIYKVIHRREGQIITDTVGLAAENGEIVLAIFQNDVGYFICTYSCGAVLGGAHHCPTPNG